MLKFSLTTILLLGTIYLTICGLLSIMQRAMLYHPTPPVTTDDAEVLWLKSDNQTLKVWHIPNTGHRAIIYFGGNAEDVAENIPQFRQLFPDYDLYLLNYRGYGGSSGTPGEEGLFADACALFDLVAEQHTDIAVIGRSLGTGVAVYLASRRPVSRLALVTPFDSMTRVASGLYPFFPVRLLLRDRYDSVARTARLKMETLILIAEHDEVIPRERTDALVIALKPELTQVNIIAATGHNTIGDAASYEKALSEFFSSHQNSLQDPPR